MRGDCDCDGNVLDECGVCGGEGVLGCADSGACNYDIDAFCDDGSCVYNDDCGVCDGDNLFIPILIVSCEKFEENDQFMFLPNPDAIHGCMDPIACNYDPEANASAQNHNGAYGCDYSCLGCNDPAACNYNYNNVVGNNDGCLYLSNCNKTYVPDNNQMPQYTMALVISPVVTNMVVQVLKLVTMIPKQPLMMVVVNLLLV